MLDKGRKSRGQRFGQAVLARIVERTGQQQRAGVVVEAIAVRTVGHGMDRMLKKPGVVAHGQKVFDLQPRRRVAVP